MRTEVIAVVVGAVMASSSTVADRPSPCKFSITRQAGPAEVVGSNDAASRASVMVQPDSPLAILRADLGGLTLTAGDTSFSRSGRHVLDVQNVSDKVILDARVFVKVGFGPGSGIGSGMKLGRPLQPGEQARVEWTSGPGRGTDSTGEVRIVALVEEVQIPGCTYRPSEAWPARTSDSLTAR